MGLFSLSGSVPEDGFDCYERMGNKAKVKSREITIGDVEEIMQRDETLAHALFADPSYQYLLGYRKGEDETYLYWTKVFRLAQLNNRIFERNSNLVTYHIDNYSAVITVQFPCDNPIPNTWTLLKSGMIPMAFSVVGITKVCAALGLLDELESDKKAWMKHNEKHFYVTLLGTRPDKQGQGLGSALLNKVTDEADRVGLPVYLESSTLRNRPVYLRAGFEILKEIQVKDTLGNQSTLTEMARPVPNRQD